MRYAGLVLLFLLVPCANAAKIHPVPFYPAKAPAMIGPYAPNHKLAKAERLASGQLQGPEDIAIDAEGSIFTGTADGTIKKVSRSGEVSTFAKTGGHPLGMDFDGAGNLIVAEPYSGLLTIDADGRVKPLVDSFEGLVLGLLDDVKVAQDGIIYFSEASSRFELHDYQLDFLEARPNGRLFSYDPLTGKTKLLLDQLYFANGIALSVAEDFLVVAETSRYRLTRLWLAGPRTGEREIFLDNLPAYPDTISSNREGIIWVAFFSIRNWWIDRVQAYPWIKGLIAQLPKRFIPQPDSYSLVVAYDEKGQVRQTLQDPKGKQLGNITSVEEYNGELYMGSLYGDAIGVISLSAGADRSDP